MNYITSLQRQPKDSPICVYRQMYASLVGPDWKANLLWPHPWRTMSTFLVCATDLNWIQEAKFTQRWQKHKGNLSFTDVFSISKWATLVREIPSPTRRNITFSPGPLVSSHCPKTCIRGSKSGGMCVCEWMMCPVMDYWPFQRLSPPLYVDFWDKVLHKGWMMDGQTDRWIS